MNFGRTTGRFAGGAALLIALSLGAAVAMTPMQDRDVPATGADVGKPQQVVVEEQEGETTPAQDQKPSGDGDSLRVGTYNPQQLFNQYHGLERFRTFVQELEAEAMAAQQAGNEQKLMELQMRYQTRQNEVVAEFEAELEEVLPEIARDASLPLVAVEIMYKEEGTTEVNLTDEIAAKINANVPQPAADETEDAGDPTAPDDGQPEGETRGP